MKMGRSTVAHRHIREPRPLPAAHPPIAYPGEGFSWNLEPKDFPFRSSSYPTGAQEVRNKLPESMRISGPRKANAENGNAGKSQRVRNESEQNDLPESLRIIDRRKSDEERKHQLRVSDRSSPIKESDTGLQIEVSEETKAEKSLHFKSNEEGDLNEHTLAERKATFIAAQVANSDTLFGFPYAMPSSSAGEVSPHTILEHPFLIAPLNGTAEDKIEQLAQARAVLLSEEREVLRRFHQAVMTIYQNKHTKLERLRREVLEKHVAGERKKQHGEMYHELV